MGRSIWPYPFHPPGEYDPRIGLPRCHLDIGIGLVIPQHGVVPWPVLFYEIVLQDKGFQLGIRYDIFKAPDMTDHLLDLGRQISAALKILPDPVLERYSLTDIDHLAKFVLMYINSRSIREFFKVFLYIEHLHVPSAPLAFLLFFHFLTCYFLYHPLVFSAFSDLVNQSRDRNDNKQSQGGCKHYAYYYSIII